MESSTAKVFTDNLTELSEEESGKKASVLLGLIDAEVNYYNKKMSHNVKSKGTLLISVIGDVTTVTGLLLTGLGERNSKG